MNYKESNLANCKEGDYIYTCRAGWVRVIDKNIDRIEVETKELYTMSGTVHHADISPSAWISNPFDINDKPPYQFKEGDEVRVWQYNHTQKRKRIFAYMKNNKYFCYNSGQTKWTSGGEVTAWNNCVAKDD